MGQNRKLLQTIIVEGLDDISFPFKYNQQFVRLHLFLGILSKTIKQQSQFVHKSLRCLLQLLDLYFSRGTFEMYAHHLTEQWPNRIPCNYAKLPLVLLCLMSFQPISKLQRPSFSHPSILNTFLLPREPYPFLDPPQRTLFSLFYAYSKQMDGIFSEEEIRFNRLNLDYIKKNDLRLIFEILMSEPEKRTVADINTLARIFLNLQPVKRIKNFSTIYHICRCMFLAKFREKTFVYQRQEEAECLYLVLNGKVGLYKRQTDIDDQEDVVFLSEGNCFGSAYNWKQKFLPLTFEETLVAVVPRREVSRLTVRVLQEREEMLKTIRKAKIFDQSIPEETLRSASQFFTLHRLPFGTFLIKQGEIPKAIYYLLKGSVRKQLPMAQQGERQELIVASYSSGDYFPKENLSDCLTFNIVAESPCEVISIPKKALKLLGWVARTSESQWKTEQYYRQQMKHQQSWRDFKSTVLSQTLSPLVDRPQPLRF